MAIADLLRNFGGKVGDTFASMGSTPLGNLTPEQQRRQNQMQGLRNLGEQFQILGAMQSALLLFNFVVKVLVFCTLIGMY